MEHFYIYCLHNDDLPEYYVGHTMNLRLRWHKHKNKCKTENYKVYQYINNIKMEVLDEIYCSLEEAIKLERYYMELLEATLNSEVPGRTKKEYHSYYMPIYYQENKEIINEKRKEKFTCICGSTLRINEQQRHFKSKKHINFIRLNIGY